MRSRTIIMLGAALVVIAAALNFREGRSGNAVVGDRDHIRLSQSSETEAVRDVSFDDMNAGERTRAARPSSGQAAEAEVKATNPLAGLLEGNGVLTMAPEAIAGWLAVNKTNAASLLAAAQMGGNSSLFLTALTNFPDDPRVLFRVAAPNQLPEARRELLDRLKAVAPENALADYLSARDHMKNGRTDEALQDLLAATGKTRFNDHG